MAGRVDAAVLREPHGLRRLLETALAGTAGRVRVAGTLDRRLAFLEDRDGRWVVADLSGQPHRTRAWPAWRSGSIGLETPGSWLSPARGDGPASYRLTRPAELRGHWIHRAVSCRRASR